MSKTAAGAGKPAPEVTPRVALDCEMVGVRGERSIEESAVAQIAILNEYGEELLNVKVKPEKPIIDYRTRFSGIKEGELDHAPPYKGAIQARVRELLGGKIIIGHDLINDFKVLFDSTSEYPRTTVDTAKTPFFQQYGPMQPRSLAKLTHEFLGEQIQTEGHDAAVDAGKTLELVKRFEPYFSLNAPYSLKEIGNAIKRLQLFKAMTPGADLSAVCGPAAAAAGAGVAAAPKSYAAALGKTKRTRRNRKQSRKQRRN